MLWLCQTLFTIALLCFSEIPWYSCYANNVKKTS